MSIQVVLPAPMHVKRAPPPPQTHAWRTLPSAPVLGLIDNGKPRAEDLLLAIGRQLQARGLVSSHFVWRKGSAAKPITTEERANMLARAHVIVSGIGD